MSSEQPNPFKRVGTVLLLVGIVDVLAMAYTVASGGRYSSSFNIFAIAAGVLLLRGGVRTAYFVRWFSAFFMISLIGLFLGSFVVTPIGLLMTQFRLNLGGMLHNYIIQWFIITVVVWAYRQLSNPKALAQFQKAGRSIAAPKSAFLTGIGFVCVLIGFAFLFFRGEIAEKTKAIAETQLGSAYRYHVTSLQREGNHVIGLVTAYTESEIKTLPIEWDIEK